MHRQGRHLLQVFDPDALKKLTLTSPLTESKGIFDKVYSRN